MKITRIAIKNFRGIRRLDVDIPPAGAIIKGHNAAGKTSVLKAIEAALAAQGVGPDAVRLGEDVAEILVDMDALTIARRITAKGATSVTVTNADGDRWTKPQTRLTEMLGTAALDALSWYLAAPKERRKLILEAMPIKLTQEDLARWLPAGVTYDLDETLLERHGMDALEEVRKEFYAKRADRNRVAKEAEAKADEAQRAVPQAPVGDVEPVAATRARTDEIVAKRNALVGRAAAATDAKKAAEGTRARIAELRANADAAEATLPGRRAGGPKQDRDYDAEVTEIRAEIQVLEQKLDEARRNLTAAMEVAREVRETKESVTSGRAQADELEKSLAGVDAMAVSDLEISVVEEEIATARAALTRSEQAEKHGTAAQRARELDGEARKANRSAAAFDEIVNTLTKTAPRELAARAAMMPGLSFEGDDILLDGVPVDSLSGAEQMRFAVELARRLNAKAKILVVDGLERLDAERLRQFVELATADDWQLLATKVADGELVVEAIEP